MDRITYLKNAVRGDDFSDDVCAGLLKALSELERWQQLQEQTKALWRALILALQEADGEIGSDFDHDVLRQDVQEALDIAEKLAEQYRVSLDE